MPAVYMVCLALLLAWALLLTALMVSWLLTGCALRDLCKATARKLEHDVKASNNDEKEWKGYDTNA